MSRLAEIPETNVMELEREKVANLGSKKKHCDPLADASYLSAGGKKRGSSPMHLRS